MVATNEIKQQTAGLAIDSATAPKATDQGQPQQEQQQQQLQQELEQVHKQQALADTDSTT